MTLTPKYKHNCDKCQLFCSDRQGDWYVCPEQVLGKTLIIRHSDEPSDYFSMPMKYLPDEYLIGAVLRGFEFTDNEYKEILSKKLRDSLNNFGINAFCIAVPDHFESGYAAFDKKFKV